MWLSWRIQVQGESQLLLQSSNNAIAQWQYRTPYPIKGGASRQGAGTSSRSPLPFLPTPPLESLEADPRVPTGDHFVVCLFIVVYCLLFACCSLISYYCLFINYWGCLLFGLFIVCLLFVYLLFGLFIDCLLIVQ